MHVYPGAEELGRVYRAQLGINASPEAFVDAIDKLPIPLSTCANKANIVASAHNSYLAWSSLDDIHTPGDVQMAQVMTTLQATLPDDTIITNGAGNYASWIHRFWKFSCYGSQLAPTSGSMGYGLPAAIAAKLNQPNRCVVAFAGDGCLQMTLQELGTAMQYKANIIILVIDNGIYGTIRMHQEKHFPNRVSGTDLVNPDFAALAQAYGGIGLTVTSTEQFTSALCQAMRATTPALIHIKTSAQAITPTKTLSDVRGDV